MSILSQVMESIGLKGFSDGATQTLSGIDWNPTHATWSWGERAPKPMQEQVSEKMNRGFESEYDPTANIKYLRDLERRAMQGFDPNPENYKGMPTADLTKSRADQILQRNSKQVSNQNARLGKMGVTKGADSFRMALENSLQNENDLGYNDLQGTIEEYNSKVGERNKEYGRRLGMADSAVKGQIGRATDAAKGWQGQIGQVGAGAIDALSGGVNPLALAGQAFKYGMPALSSFGNAMSKTALDLPKTVSKSRLLDKG